MPTLQTITDLRGPAGQLEALLNTGAPHAPFAVLLCHPHTPSGGTMHNKVVYRAMKTFNSLGLPVLRFNFRGAGLSAGAYDHGHGERDDVQAALNWLRAHLNLPILLAGFSFGAAVSLAAGYNQPDVRGLIALGLPVQTPHRSYTYDFLPKTTIPKLFLLGDHDRYAPKPAVEAIFATAAGPKTLLFIPTADHFFADITHPADSHLPEMQAALHNWLLATFPTELTPSRTNIPSETPPKRDVR